MKIFLLFSLVISSVVSSFAQTTPKPSPTVSAFTNKDAETTASPLPSPISSPPIEAAQQKAPGEADKTVQPPEPASRYVRKDAPVHIPRFNSSPTIDGKLDDAVWQNAAVFGDFIQIQPGDNVAPTHPTEFMMAYDAKNLYMAFRVKQDRDKVRATVARRDNIFNDDYVLVYIDTFNDDRQAYVIFFNPLGIQADGTFTEGRGEDYSVDLLMESKGVLTEDGFTIEAAVPFKSLRYEAGKGKNWGLSIFRRVKYNNNEYNSWTPFNRSVTGYLNQSGSITGLEGISTTRQLEINPSFTLSESGRRTRHTFDGDPNGRYINEGLKGEFGFTAKFGLTPTITLDFAYNPDFAQVEADAPVTTANVRFPIFFPEKRPFFLERIDIFQTPMNVVNTRAIVDPDVAVKLTGRRGRNTFGLMYASDNAPGNYSKDERESLLIFQDRCRLNPNVNSICGIEPFVDKNAEIGVLRLKRDVGRQHNLGFFATTYNFPGRHNHVGGFDGRFRLAENLIADFQVIGTNSRRVFYDSELNQNLYRTGNGFGYRVYLERTGRNLYMNYLATGRTRNYRADVGFTQRVDTNYAGSFIRYETDRDAKKSIIYKRLFNESNVSYDWRGRSQLWQSNTQGMLALQRQIYIGGGFEFGYERVFEHEFGARRTASRPNQGAFFGPDPERSSHRREVYGFIEVTPVKQLFFLWVLGYSPGVLDYDLGAGPKYPRVSPAALQFGQNARLDPGPGDLLFIESSVRYQPTTAWQAQFSYNRRRLVRDDTGRVAFDDNVFSLRSTYQFTRDIFARARLDYSNISTRIRPQLILGWTPSPGTAIYAGYNDDLNYHGYNPYTGRHEPGFRGNGRTFFIKASYLFRKSF
ncbi:MAG: carbohydrate binding family 9 domain-containing protein [Acidobacteriota bacterium]|nr:carbohydrate binding family 9 domain-containing protein [Acidobacteriota bacterium]